MFCAKCGKENSDGDAYCCGCGAPLNDDVPPVAAEQQPAQPAVEVGGKKGKIVAARDKVLSFEKKHGVIVNALILVCSVIIMFVTLFAPIKVMAYDYAIADDEKGESYHYVEIDQTIWDMFGALGYIGLDNTNPADAVKIAEIRTEYTMAMSAAQSEIAAGEDSEQAISDHLSDINYIALTLAVKSGKGFSALFENGGGSAFLSLVFGLVITVLSIIMAIMSLVRIIFAIIGLVKKKTPKGFYSYIGTMLGLNISSLALLAVSPMFTLGGGMLGIFFFVTVLMLVLGALYSLVMGNWGLAAVIKKSAISLGLLIGAGLLCTNCINVGKVNVPYGYGLFGIFNSVTNPENMGQFIGAFAIGILGLGAMECALKAARYQINELAFIDMHKRPDKHAFNNSLGVVIMAFLMIMVQFVGIPYGFSHMPFFVAEAGVRAQVYVAAVFCLAALIVMKAYRPLNKPMFPAPDSGYVTANGAPAPSVGEEQPVSASVEDVKEPEVGDAAPVADTAPVAEESEKPSSDDLSGL